MSQNQGLSTGAAMNSGLISSDGGAATLIVRLSTPAPTERAKRAPLDVAFVLDRSGSMSGSMGLVKQAADLAISNLEDQDRAALVVYDDSIDTLCRVQETTPRAKTAMRLALMGIDARGSTNLGGGWMTGCQELASVQVAGEPTRIRRTLLLTDGQANVGVIDPAELARHASELRARGISTTTLGFGEHFDEQLLSGMAEAGGGNFQYIASADQLAAFFAKELGELLSITASNIQVRITTPEGMKAWLVNFFPHKRINRTRTIELGDLAAGGEVALVFDVAIDAAEIGTTFQPTIEVSWTDTTTDTRHTVTVASPVVTAASPADALAAPQDEAVLEEGALQRAAKAQREAARADYEGRYADRVLLHRQAMDLLEEAPLTDEVAARRSMTKVYMRMDPSRTMGASMRKEEYFNAMERSRKARRDVQPQPPTTPAEETE